MVAEYFPGAHLLRNPVRQRAAGRAKPFDHTDAVSGRVVLANFPAALQPVNADAKSYQPLDEDSDVARRRVLGRPWLALTALVA